MIAPPLAVYITYNSYNDEPCAMYVLFCNQTYKISLLIFVDDPIEPENEVMLAWQPGCTVTLFPPDTVIKWGSKVKPAEEAAMRLVQRHAPHIPIPTLHRSTYESDGDSDGRICYGELTMSLVPGESLKTAWARFDDTIKARICNAIWDLVAEIQKIPRPASLISAAPQGQDIDIKTLYCTADGSPSRDPLLGTTNDDDVCPRFFNETTLHQRIYARYIAHNGLSYRDSKDYLPQRLPHSDQGQAVFTHGDIGPRNIMVDPTTGYITGVLDWESSGWFPDWWEYAQMMKPCDEREHEWKRWMARMKPVPWDITAIQKARRVLF